MSKKKDYDPAHKKASEIEYFCRKNPKKLDEELKKEIKKVRKTNEKISLVFTYILYSSFFI